MSHRVPCLDAVLAEWTHTRKLSIDYLLSFDSSEDLLKVPARNMGAMWKQFRHIGRVQEDYNDALSHLKIEFSTDRSSYDGGPCPKQLVKYLEHVDQEMIKAIEEFGQLEPENKKIDWFGESVALEIHLVRLISHETLHHGQWIMYGRSLDVKFPSSWKAWGL